MDELDFDNYSVPVERAECIRQRLQHIRNENWVSQLHLLVQEQGQVDEENTDLDESGTKMLPGFGKSEKAWIYRGATNTASEGLEIHMNAQELKVHVKQIKLLEVGFLGKGAEYAIYFVSEEHWDLLATTMSTLDELFKAAKGSKAERHATWKARFAQS